MNIIQLLFPPKCVFCQKTTENRLEICPFCAKKLPFLDEKDRKTAGEFFESAVSPLAYEGEVRLAVRRFKFSGKQSYGAAFAKIMANELRDCPELLADFIVPVPTNAQNVRKRGYNHACILAKELGKLLGLPVYDILKKQRKTTAMHGLNRHERQQNIKDAIMVAGSHDKISRARILLVDDIITSGATLNECAKTLLLAGAREVNCATFAKALQDN